MLAALDRARYDRAVSISAASCGGIVFPRGASAASSGRLMALLLSWSKATLLKASMVLQLRFPSGPGRDRSEFRMPYSAKFIVREGRLSDSYSPVQAEFTFLLFYILSG